MENEDLGVLILIEQHTLENCDDDVNQRYLSFNALISRDNEAAFLHICL